MTDLLSLLSKGIELYKELIDAPSTGMKTMSLSQFDEQRRLASLTEALSLDPTGVTAILLLKHYVESHLSSKSFSWLQLLREPALAEILLKPSDLLSHVEHPLVNEAADVFREGLTAAVKHYECDARSDVKELLSSPEQLAFLRHDALKAMGTLSIDQFSDGDSEVSDVMPAYSKIVYQWWNINSLIASVATLPSGVALNLIRKPDGYSSYFAFSIRNGSRIFVLSDIEKRANPLQHLNSRRPDRSLSARINKNWFPYDLLNLEWSEEANRLFFSDKSRCTNLAVRQSEVLPIARIADLDASTVIWLSMMFELIVDKFWKQEFRADKLSYTGEMVRDEVALLRNLETANLPALQYEKLNIQPISIEEAVASGTSEAIGVTAAVPNQWMVDRYKDSCAPDALNLTGTDLDTFSVVTPFNKELPLAVVKQMPSPRHVINHSTPHNQIHPLIVTDFGTKEKLEADRLWLARYNLAVSINTLANEEYVRRAEEVTIWFRNRVLANLDYLVSLAGHETLYREFELPGRSTFGYHIETSCSGVQQFEPEQDAKETSSSRAKLRVKVLSLVSKEALVRHTSRSRDWFDGYCPSLDEKGNPLCVVTGKKAHYVVAFSVVTADDIAFLAGCSVAELPDVLRDFNGVRYYFGNDILDRIDPFLTKLKNPWLKADFRVRLGFSKRGWAKAKNAMGTPPSHVQAQ